MHMQKKSSSVKITLLLKVDLEGFEPFCQVLDVIGADYCIIRHRGIIWHVWDFF